TNQRETTILWDRRSGVPMTVLPEVRDSAGEFGVIDKGVLGHSLPICAVAGDQQAALVGQACFAAGDVKSTNGTGAFLVLNTAQHLVPSKHRLLSTIAYQLNGVATYALAR
ncbi:MAG: glycerol kinase, partial [Gammaproteobacteria bacterium]